MWKTGILLVVAVLALSNVPTTESHCTLPWRPGCDQSRGGCVAYADTCYYWVHRDWWYWWPYMGCDYGDRMIGWCHYWYHQLHPWFWPVYFRPWWWWWFCPWTHYCQHTEVRKSQSYCNYPYFGSQCQGVCSSCSGHGWCDWGIRGNGQCSCYAPWVGSQCQYSVATTCNGHASRVDASGRCYCYAQYTGASCNQCAAGYYEYPECSPCNPKTDCNGHGTCSALQKSKGCDCYHDTSRGFWKQPNCKNCEKDYYPVDKCTTYCVAASTCSGHGTCSSTGTCQCAAGYAGANCNQCDANYYGYPNCQACPACGGTGHAGNPRCNPTSGTCNCINGWVGTACQYSRATTCDNHGTPNPTTGTPCVCDKGYGRDACDYCATGYVPQNVQHPATCTVCNCNHGTCNADTSCTCQTGWSTSSRCATCVTPPYFPDANPPTKCTYCTATETCSNHGTCSATGSCVCTASFTGTNCNQCLSGYWGASCAACPGLPGPACNGHSNRCNDGIGGDGTCTCVAPYNGPQCTHPGISTVTPASLTTQSQSLTLTGVCFKDCAPAGTPTVVATHATLPQMTCTIVTVTDTQIVCTLPMGYGGTGWSVTVTRSSLSNTRDNAFAYLAPTLAALSPTTPCATAGCTLTLTGGNFGARVADNVVTLTSQAGGSPVTLAPRAGLAWNSMVLDVPAVWAGRKIALALTVAGRATTPASLSFAYVSPHVTGFTGTFSTAGGNVATIVGTGLGATGFLSATINSMACTSIDGRTDTQANCHVTPPGVGTLVPASISTVDVTENDSLFNYDAPRLDSATGCNPGPSGTTINCPMEGVDITLQGVNFGAAKTIGASTLTVSINFGSSATTKKDCPIVSVTHTAIVCHAPASTIAQTLLPVTVTRTSAFGGASQTYTASLLSYGGPRIDPMSVHVLGQAGVVDPTDNTRWRVDTVSTTPNMIIQFTGQAFGDYLNLINVTYTAFTCTAGNDGCSIDAKAHEFDCPLVCAQAADCSATKLTCQLTAGVGARLRLIVRVRSAVTGTVQVSTPSRDVIYYPAPTVRAGGSLRLSPYGSYQTTVRARVSEDQLLYIGGANFGTLVDCFRVVLTKGTATIVCDPAQISENEMVCSTNAGTDVGWQPKMYVGCGASEQSVLDTDTFDYPVPPVISRVYSTACTDANPNLVSCPTSGKNADGSAVRLTIYGTNFDPYRTLTVTVGDQPCVEVHQFFPALANPAAPDPAGNEVITCVLPAGVGLNYEVQAVQAGILLSPTPGPKVSYAAPSLVSLSGCPTTAADGTPSNCARAGGSTLTVQGANFGTEASVLVGGLACTNVQHDVAQPDSKLTCTLPATTSIAVTLAPVALIQTGGQTATGLNVIYATCPAGTSGMNCDQCLAGTFSPAPASLSCTQCPAGTFAGAPGATACTTCAPGSVSAVGASSCTACLAGQYSASTQTCAKCPAGTFSQAGWRACQTCPAGYVPNGAQTQCVACAAGTAALAGQATCTACPVGHFSSAQAQSVCQACPKGSFVGTTGATSCQACGLGEANDVIGRAQCMTCPAGTFTDATGSFECKACSPGSFSSAAHSSSCQACLAGSFAETPGATQCTPCPRGSFQAGPGAVACLLCAPGSSQSATGQSACAPCLAGYSASEYGAAFCDACDPGTFTSGTGAAFCTPCDPGKFSNVAGLSACQACSGGYFASSAGQSACSQCEAGSHSRLASGSVDCEDCPVGSITSADGQAVCKQCAAGTFMGHTGGTACEVCLPGTWVSTPGASMCPDCPIGTYGLGTAACDSCDLGTYTDEPRSTTCYACRVGSYSNITHATTCPTCEFGTYSSLPGVTACVQCREGHFAINKGQTSCVMCARGSFAPLNGSADCTPCPAGLYSDRDAATECETCLAGTFSATPAQSSCTACERGMFNPDNAGTQCFDCALGSVAPSPGQSTCFACELGSYSLGKKQRECLQCPAGSYQDVLNVTSCMLCPAGAYSPIAGQSACQACAEGSYAISAGSLKCSECQAGFYAASQGQTSCFRCGLGTYSPTVSSQTCDVCAPGHYSAAYGSTTCKACARGYAAPNNRSSACTPCPVGFHQPAEGGETCLICKAGSASSDLHASTCTDCQPGYFSAQDGSSTCSPCPAGTYAAGFGSTVCVACPAGRYSVGAAAECTLCEPGSFMDHTGAAKCDWCQAGSYAKESGSLACSACPEGTYASGPHTAVCSACPAGSFSGLTGQISCQACPAGTEQPLTGQRACSACAAGHFSPGGLPLCPKCAAGSYQPDTQKSSCIACAAGMFQYDEGQVTCAACNVGFYSADVGAKECTACAPGYFNDAGQQTTCKACAAGTHQSMPGQSICTQCEAGTFGPSTGEANCDLCVPGTFSSAVGRTTPCDKCAAGEAQPNPGAQSCEACGAGYYSPETGSPFCLACDSGFFSTATRATACQACQPGEFAPAKASQSCQSCPTGTFGAVSGMPACVPCPKGKYNGATGKTVCTDCEAFRYQPFEGQLTCLDCPIGTYGFSTGLAKCNECPKGRFGDTLGLAECKVCPAGQYQDETGKTICKTCAAGHVPAFDQDQCVSCAMGTYADQPGQTVCRACQAGWAQSALGQAACVECAAGSYSSQAGAPQCTVCPAGSFSASSHATTCTACAEGAYQPNTGRSTCVQPLAGRYVRPGTGASEDEACPAGTFQPLGGQTFCTLCAPGTYSAAGATACTACGVNTFAGQPGAGACSLCPTGTFSNATGLSACRTCADGTWQGQVGRSSCSPCDTGHYSHDRHDVCDECPHHWVMPNTGATACLQCPEYSTEYAPHVQCVCDVAYCAVAGIPPYPITCQKCVPGSSCLSEGMVCKTVSNLMGYWLDPLSPRSNPQFYLCQYPANCPANSARTTENGSLVSVCPEHRGGPLCAFCETGYTESFDRSTCKACNTAADRAAQVIIFLAFAALVVVFYKYIINEPLSQDVAKATFVTVRGRRSVIAEQPTIANTPIHALPPMLHSSAAQVVQEQRASWWRSGLTWTAEQLDWALKNCTEVAQTSTNTSSLYAPTPIRDEKEESKDPAYQAQMRALEQASHDAEEQEAVTNVVKVSAKTERVTFLYITKIFIGFVQVVISLNSMTGGHWPAQFFLALNYALPLHPTDCGAGMPYLDAIVWFSSAPLMLLAVGTLCYWAYLRCTAYRSAPDAEGTDEDRNARVAHQQSVLVTRVKLVRCVLFTFYVLYPTVIARLLSVFSCRELRGEYYLVADFHVQCYTDSHNAHMVGAAVLLAVYIGLQIALLAALFWFKRAEEDERSWTSKEVLGFLKDAYHNDATLFEVVDVVEKMMLTSLIAAFFPFGVTDFQIPFAMLIVTVYIGLILYLAPFLRRDDERLQLYSQLLIFSFLFMAWIAQREVVQGVEQRMTDGEMAAVMYVFSVVFILMFASNALLYWYHKQPKREKAVKARQEPEESDNEDIPHMAAHVVHLPAIRIQSSESAQDDKPAPATRTSTPQTQLEPSVVAPVNSQAPTPLPILESTAESHEHMRLTSTLCEQENKSSF